MPLYPFLVGRVPKTTKIAYRQKSGTLILNYSLEDLEQDFHGATAVLGLEPNWALIHRVGVVRAGG